MPRPDRGGEVIEIGPPHAATTFYSRARQSVYVAVFKSGKKSLCLGSDSVCPSGSRA